MLQWSSFLRIAGECIVGESRGCCCFLLISLATGRLPAQQKDLIDVSKLGDRGVIFEVPDLSEVKTARGVFDFDGDGFDDIAVIAEEVELVGHIALALIYGRPGMTGRHALGLGIDRTAGFPLQGPAINNFDAGPLGDLDGDARADLFVRDFSFQRNLGGGRGAAFVIYGVPGLEGEPSLQDVGGTIRGSVIESTDPEHDGIGFSMVNVGDFDGDGEADLALSAATSDPNGRSQAGVVFLLYRGRELPSAVDLAGVGTSLPGTRILGRVRPADANGRLRGDWLGWGMSPVGDFNGDGLGDLALMTNNNIVFLVLGRRSPPQVIDLELLPPDAGGEGVVVLRGPRTTPLEFTFGIEGEVAGIGDLNGDGLSDLALGLSQGGLPGRPGHVDQEGRIQVIYGHTDPPGFIDFASLPEGIGPRIHGADTEAGKSFGFRVAPAGDLNSDGVPDLLTGGGPGSYGSVYGIFGRRDLGADRIVVDDLDGLQVFGEAGHGGLGSSISSAGDFNGDAALDVVVMASGWKSRGAAYVVYGTGGGAVPFSLLGVSPDMGSVKGGTTVNLRGSGFRGTPEVRFGDRPADRVVVSSATALRAVTPPGLAYGQVDVSVKVEGVTQTLSQAFEYIRDLPVVDLAAVGGKGLVVDGESPWLIGGSAALGDITGDGIDDLAVGLLGSPVERAWRVFIVAGGPGLPERIKVSEPGPGRSIISSQESRWFEAFNVAALGDLNGDGAGELGIAPGFAAGYLLLGRTSLPEALDIDAERAARRAVKLELTGDDPLAFERGFVLAPLGDLTGDGLADFAVGLGESPLTANEGRIFFVRGSRDLPEVIDLYTSPLVFAEIHGSADQRLGTVLAAVGDVNGDGFADLLTSGWEGASSAYLLYLGPGMPRDSELEAYLIASHGGVDLQVLPPFFGHASGIHVAPAGDVNRDGRPDLLLGREIGGEDRRGVTFLVFGSKDLPPVIQLDEEPAQPDGVVRIFGEAGTVQSGRRSGPVGDLNGDGYGDFVVGQSGKPGQPGSFCLILGGASLPARIDLGRLGGLGVRIAALNVFTDTYVPVARTGDLNGDGAADMVLAETEGGTSPGAIYALFGPAPSFRRGDPNRDGVVDLTDAIFELAHLFLGDPSAICEDAADTDDNGRLELTDAIYLLQHLYLGGPPPPAPYPEPAQDPTADDLRCTLF